MSILYFILITVLTGWWLGTVEVPVGFSGFIATGTVRNRYMGLGIIIFFILGACLFSGQLTESFVFNSSLTSSVSAVVIAFSASLAVLATYKISRYSSICYAIVGAVIAWNYFIHSRLELLAIVKLMISWLLVPIISGLIAALLYKIYRFFLLKSNIHLLLLMRYLRVALLFIAMLFVMAIGMNNGALLMTLNKTISPGFDFSWNGTDIGKGSILLVGSVLLIAILSWRKASSKIRTMAEGEFDASMEAILITLLSGIFVFLFFSIPVIPKSVGLIATPISVAAVIIGGLTGINMVKRGRGNEYFEEYRMLASTVVTPMAAFVIAYFILNIIDTESFLPNSGHGVIQPSNIINITPVITTVLLLGFVTFLIIYLRSQRKIRLQAEIVLLENQNRLFENQKAMSALEVKTVITENEQLSARLEFRRKELINIALGITEQKNFQEELYKEIKSLKELDDPEKLKQGIDAIEKQLLQKMNYSQELESFYAQIESLHKDFNMRLTEKYPNLTEQERRLTTLLRLGFSSKHIASLMNISPKSVEMSRYRLRNRLGLDHDQKLIAFIKDI